MNTIRVNAESLQRNKNICLGDEADKMRNVFPQLKAMLHVAMEARANRSIKVNAALLYDNDGIWLASLAFLGWTGAEVQEALTTLVKKVPTITNVDYKVLVWALDGAEKVSVFGPASATLADPVTFLVHGDARLEGRLGQVQHECECAMADELNRFLARPAPAPLRLSLLLVRDFNGDMEDSWRAAFESEEQWKEVIPSLMDMSLAWADGIAFPEPNNADRSFLREVLAQEQQTNRLADLIDATDTDWLLDPTNTHLMCVGPESESLVRETLNGKRNVMRTDVHVIQTAYANPKNSDSSYGVVFDTAKLIQGNAAGWLFPDRPLGITMTHYIYQQDTQQ